MVDQQTDSGNVCDDPLNESQETIGDYIARYNKIHQQILSLENELKILKTTRQRYETTIFDQQIHRLNDMLNDRKAEIGPVVLILGHALSYLTAEKDRQHLYELVFLRQTTREIALCHGGSEQSASCAFNRVAKIPIPDTVVKEYGKILKE